MLRGVDPTPAFPTRWVTNTYLGCLIALRLWFFKLGRALASPGGLPKTEMAELQTRASDSVSLSGAWEHAFSNEFSGHAESACSRDQM